MSMSRNPYHIGNSEPSLRPSVFAYFDILGYVDFVHDAYATGAQAQALAKVYSAVTGGREGLEEKNVGAEFNATFKKDRFALKAFTDNIVIGWPIHNDVESELEMPLES
jgi:hypothetical protein